MVCCDLCIIKVISMLDSYESDVISIIPQQKKKKKKFVFLKLLSERMMQSSCLRCIVDIMDGRLNFRPHTSFLCK